MDKKPQATGAPLSNSSNQTADIINSPGVSGQNTGFNQPATAAQTTSVQPVGQPATTDTAPAAMPPPDPPGVNRLKKLLVTAGMIAAALLLITAAVFAIEYFRSGSDTELQNATELFDNTQVELDNLVDGGGVSVLGTRKLIINGQLQSNNGLVVTPGQQPDNPVTGQIYVDEDTNQLGYYDGSQFIFVTEQEETEATETSSINGTSGDFATGTGLVLVGTTLNNSGVLSFQGQTGAVTLTAGAGIGINGTTITNNGDLTVGNEITNVVAGGGLARIGSGTTLSPYEVSLQACPSGQVLKSTGGGAWGCDNDAGGASFTAGDGLQLIGSEFSVDSPTCAGTDKLQWNGTAFVCSADVDTDTDTTYDTIANGGLRLSGTSFGLAICTNGQILQAQVTNGEWACADPDSVGISYTAGDGLQLNANEFSIDSPTCAGTDKLQWTGTAFVCAADVDTDTTYTAGTGLDLVGTTFNNTGVLTVSASGALQSSGGQNPTIAFNDGANAGEVWQWNGAAWVLVDIAAAGGDGVIGNEVLDVTSGTSGLTRSGTGTTGDPYTLGIIDCANTEVLQSGGAGVWACAASDSVGTSYNVIANGGLRLVGSNFGLQVCASGELLQAQPTSGEWDCVAPGSVGPTVTLQDAYDNGNTITTSDGRNILFTLDDTTTDSNFVVNMVGTGNQIQFQDGGTDIFRLVDGGAATFQNTVNSTSAFRVLNAAGTTTAINVDTANGRVGVGTDTPTAALHIVQSDQGSDYGLRITESGSDYIRLYVDTGNENFLYFGETWYLGPTSVNSHSGTIRAGRALNLNSFNDINSGSVNLQIGGTNVATFNNTGQATLQNTANSTAAFRILNVVGTSLFTVDSSNALVRVDPAGISADASFTSGTGAVQIGSDTGANIGIDSNEIIARNNGSSSTLFVQNGGGGLTVGADFVQFQNATNGTTALQVLNVAGDVIMTVDTIDGELELGDSTNIGGTLLFRNATNSFVATLTAPTLSAHRSVTLPNEDGVVCIQSSTNCGFATGSGIAFLQDGNSFGAIGTLGTNDNFDLGFETRGTTWFTLEGAALQGDLAPRLLGTANADIVLQGATAYFSNPQGSNSESFGLQANATGDNAVALGFQADASGNDAVSIGYQAGSSTNGIVAIGYQASAVNNGTAIGFDSSSGSSGVAIGSDSAASSNGVALGRNTSSSSGSVAIGRDSTTGGSQAIAIGRSSSSTSSSIAIGWGASSSTTNQLVVGGGSTEGYINDAYFGSGVVSSAPQSITINATGGSGTDVAGAGLTFAGGRGTGSANGGDISFQIATPGASGSSLNALTTVGTLSGADGAFTLQNAVDSTSGFQVLDADGGSPIISADTISEQVGIGTASPDAKLDIVHSDINESGLKLHALSGQVADLFVAYNSSGQRTGYFNEKGEIRVIAAADNSVALRIKQRSGTHTANLTEWADISNNILSYFDANARLSIGSGSALPNGVGLRVAGDDGAIPTIANRTNFLIHNTSDPNDNASMSIVSGNSGFSSIFFGDTDDENIGQIEYWHDFDLFRFTANGQLAFNIQDTGITVFGGTATLGDGSTQGGLVLNDGNGQTTTIQAGDSTSGLTFILPTAAGSNGECIKQGPSANQLIFDSCGGGSSSFVQDGNSFGAAAVLGTNDTFDLAFETDSTTRWSITTAGHFIPNVDDTYDIGSSTNRVRELFVGPASLHVGTDGDEGVISYNTTTDEFEFDRSFSVTGGTTINGGGIPASGFGDNWQNFGDNPGSQNDPYYMAIDTVNNKMYIIDDGVNQYIMRFDSGGGGTTYGANLETFGSTGSGTGQFNDPSGIAVDPDNNKVYVSDDTNNRIARFDSGDGGTTFGQNWEAYGSTGSGTNNFDAPNDIAVDSLNNKVYVSDINNSRIARFDSGAGGTTLGQNRENFGSNGSSTNQFDVPLGVTLDNQADKLYVMDFLNSRVARFDSGSGGTTFGGNWQTFGSSGSGTGQFFQPEDVAIDVSDAKLYVADGENDRIAKFDSGADGTTFGANWEEFGTTGSGTNQFNDPEYVVLDDVANRVYVSDWDNGRYVSFDGGISATSGSAFSVVNGLDSTLFDVDTTTGDITIGDGNGTISLDGTLISPGDLTIAPGGGNVNVDGNILPSAGGGTLGSAAQVWFELYLDDDGSIVFGDSQESALTYNDASDRLEITGADADLFIEDRLGLGVQDVVVANDGTASPAAFNLTPTASVVQVTCNDISGGCEGTMQETSVREGDILVLINISTNNVIINNSSGVSELTGSFNGGLHDNLTMIYLDSAWIELSRSNIN